MPSSVPFNHQPSLSGLTRSFSHDRLCAGTIRARARKPLITCAPTVIRQLQAGPLPSAIELARASSFTGCTSRKLLRSPTRRIEKGDRRPRFSRASRCAAHRDRPTPGPATRGAFRAYKTSRNEPIFALELRLNNAKSGNTSLCLSLACRLYSSNLREARLRRSADNEDSARVHGLVVDCAPHLRWLVNRTEARA